MEQTDKKTWPGWETVREIGRGSFGAVYEIQREIRGKTERAALKVISTPHDESEIHKLRADGYNNESITEYFSDSKEKIEDEYAMMADLKGHTNVVYCDEIRTVQHDDGFGWDIYIKMELLTPLKSHLSDKVNDAQVIKLGMDICDALKFCEELNVVHRDIKPENIFVSRNGNYKLGDFGIAKTMEGTSGGTKTGTYDFMAPEVYNNRPYHTQVDIYSLGLVMYWLLNNRTLPFLSPKGLKPTPTEKCIARERRFSGEQIPMPKNGSKDLKQIVLKACAYDPKDRYQSAREMLADLQMLQNGKHVYIPEEERSIRQETIWEKPDEEGNEPGNGKPKTPGKLKKEWKHLAAAVTVLILVGIATVFMPQSDKTVSDGPADQTVFGPDLSLEEQTPVEEQARQEELARQEEQAWQEESNRCINITQQPVDTSTEVDTRISIIVEADGVGLSYQWRYAKPGSDDFQDSNMTSPLYSIVLTKEWDGMRVYCLITDRHGHSRSTDIVTLSNCPNGSNPITILKQTKEVTIKKGEHIYAKSIANGDGLKYQWWYCSGTNFVKADSASNKCRVDAGTKNGKINLLCIITDRNGNTKSSEMISINVK